jgi:excisionase family DNA binding protein
MLGRMSISTYATTKTHVTAIEAADLTGHSERTIRRWLASGKLRGSKTPRRDWQIAVSDLPAPAQRHGHELEEMRQRVERLERELRLLRLTRSQMPSYAAIAPATGLEPNLSEQTARTTYDTAPAPAERHTAVYVASGVGSFHHRSDAARWLVRHGVNNERTPKTWPGWDDSLHLDPRSVLQLAIRLCDPHNHRINWRLHRCVDDPACVCQELLPA